MSEPLPLSEASLLVLRPALNAPVLNVGFLPVGPARAAIVAFGEEWGGIGLALGIRSNEGGQVAVFRNREPLQPDVSISQVLEPVLAEAEKMGFLFDEDMVGDGASSKARSSAMDLWRRLMGELETPAPRPAPATPAAQEPILELIESPSPRLSSPPPRLPDDEMTAPMTHGDTLAGGEGLEELVLDAVASVEVPEIDLAPSDALPPARKAANVPVTEAQNKGEKAASLAQPGLSKFRSVDASAEDPNGKNDRGSELGRIPLVRVRRGRSGSASLPFLARLLSSF